MDEIKLKLDSLLSLYSVVESKQSELEIERNKYQLIEGQDGIIHMLINKNRKLESELDNMKVTLEQVKLGNELIQKTFDMRQNVWIKANVQTIVTKCQFLTLHNRDSPPLIILMH